MPQQFTNNCIPGHALHEKGLQRQIGVGTLVSSQERRALVAPRINRRITAGQPLVCSPISLRRIRLLVLPGSRSKQFIFDFRATGGVGGAAIRGPALGGAACGYPGYPLLTRRGSCHL